MITNPDRTGRGGTASEQYSSKETADDVLAYLRSVATEHQVAEAAISDIRDALAAIDRPLGAGTAKRAIRLLIARRDLEVLRRGTGGKYRSRYRVLTPVTATTAA